MSDSLQVQLRKGVLEMCVLTLLEQEDGYAYDIASRLADEIGMGEGTIYPLMRRMQAEGLVTTYLQESKNGPSRKYYRLTKKGRTVLDQQKVDWNAFASAVEKILTKTKGPSAKKLRVVK